MPHHSNTGHIPEWKGLGNSLRAAFPHHRHRRSPQPPTPILTNVPGRDTPGKDTSEDTNEEHRAQWTAADTDPNTTHTYDVWTYERSPLH
ncbi:hypothetical protein GCM10009753_37460 [Streptantibioticus ferralitis]